MMKIKTIQMTPNFKKFRNFLLITLLIPSFKQYYFTYLLRGFMILVNFVIISNTITLAMDRYPISDLENEILNILN